MRHQWATAQKVILLPQLFHISPKMQAITDKMVFSLPDFMASPDKKRSDNQRPRPLHLSKSFSKVEPVSPDHSTRGSRASTISNGVISEVIMADKSNAVVHNGKARRQPDAFEKSPEDEDNGIVDDAAGKLPDDFDELPIELVSLSDR